MNIDLFMKLRYLFLPILLTASLHAEAQYSGGNGRGEVSLEINGRILNEDIILVSGSSGANGYYHSLSNNSGAFSAINARDQAGRSVSVTIWGSSTTETGTYSLNAGNWNDIIIYPKITGLRISGSGSGLILTLNGTSNTTIDGSLNAAGAANDLMIKNIQYTNSGADNHLKDCILTGDLSLTGPMTVTLQGSVSVGGNLNVGNGSTLFNYEAATLMISGNLAIFP